MPTSSPSISKSRKDGARPRRAHIPPVYRCSLLNSVKGAPARDYGQYRDIDPALCQWIEELKDKTGQGCCETADGHPAEYEWDTAGNRYKVRIEGEWYVVPAEAVVEGPNKLGFATVWYWWSFDLGGKKTQRPITLGVFCLVRAAELSVRAEQ